MTNQFSVLRAVWLVLCLVFTSSASAYMHIGEHQHSQEVGLSHHHAADAHQHSQQDQEHDQHFHVHLLGDLVNYPALIADANLQATAQEISPRICSLAYAPLIPPPNA
ncbi:MAG: hypothetical protein RQ732_08230 [Methylophaga sp.]|nr:hypothetical protein [Methylophaga sp.]